MHVQLQHRNFFQMRKSSLAVIAGIVPNSAVAEEDDLAVRDGVKYGKSKKAPRGGAFLSIYSKILRMPQTVK